MLETIASTLFGDAQEAVGLVQFFQTELLLFVSATFAYILLFRHANLPKQRAKAAKTWRREPNHGSGGEFRQWGEPRGESRRMKSPPHMDLLRRGGNQKDEKDDAVEKEGLIQRFMTELLLYVSATFAEFRFWEPKKPHMKSQMDLLPSGSGSLRKSEGFGGVVAVEDETTPPQQECQGLVGIHRNLFRSIRQLVQEQHSPKEVNNDEPEMLSSGMSGGRDECTGAVHAAVVETPPPRTTRSPTSSYDETPGKMMTGHREKQQGPRPTKAQEEEEEKGSMTERTGAAAKTGHPEKDSPKLDDLVAQKHIANMRKCGQKKNFEGSVALFAELQDFLQKKPEDQKGEILSKAYNVMLEVCIDCKDLIQAEVWTLRAKDAGVANVTCYNALIKARLHLPGSDFDRAQAVLVEMRRVGVQPNLATFNTLLNAISCDKDLSRRRETMNVVREMQKAGVKPNRLSCSCAMKSLQADSTESDIEAVIELMDAMETPPDEGLLGNMADATTRLGKPELLNAKLQELLGENKEGAEPHPTGGNGSSNNNSGAATTTTTTTTQGVRVFNGLIKGYGHAGNIRGVWRTWDDMKKKGVRPSCITVGCMVEALAANGDPEGALTLLHQLDTEESSSREELGLDSPVAYCSVMKGFARERKFKRALAVYQEMTGNKGMDIGIVAFNILIDACARCSQMNYLPKLLEDMATRGVKPNLVSYSTMAKGHCLAGDLKSGLAVLDEMRQKLGAEPDEIFYNSLLDGCVRNRLLDEADQLFAQMQDRGVKPSNFTLAIMVKALSLAGKLDAAFELTDSLCRRYRFRPNAPVFASLLQACILNRRPNRASSVLEWMLKENVVPEGRTYAGLVKCCIKTNSLGQVVALLRSGLALPNAEKESSSGSSSSLRPAKSACAWRGWGELLNEALSVLTERGQARSAVLLINDLVKLRPEIALDPEVVSRARKAAE